MLHSLQLCICQIILYEDSQGHEQTLAWLIFRFTFLIFSLTSVKHQEDNKDTAQADIVPANADTVGMPNCSLLL